MPTATFGAGCFWGVEEIFRQIDGVATTTVGFMGGTVECPSYREVGTGNTGHVEVVRLEFDDDRVSYEKLLHIFWTAHDPTQFDRQGQDAGSQYRSVIFFLDADQEQRAHASLAAHRPDNGQPVLTQIMAASRFWPAEEYHQQYLAKRGQAQSATSRVSG
jgi:peptide-methionine (S)-S-oxide reductase